MVIVVVVELEGRGLRRGEEGRLVEGLRRVENHSRQATMTVAAAPARKRLVRPDAPLEGGASSAADDVVVVLFFIKRCWLLLLLLFSLVVDSGCGETVLVCERCWLCIYKHHKNSDFCARI